jgi:protein SCO1/2
MVPGYTRSIQVYQVPDLPLVRADEVTVNTHTLLATDQPVIVSFIYTSCGAVCPVLSATLAQARQYLGADAARVRILSISIDPAYDTPARLRAYGRQFHADGDWRFYTGDPAAIVTLQRAFDAYRGDKTNHTGLTLLRPAGQTHWVRLEGFTSARELVAELRRPPES